MWQEDVCSRGRALQLAYMPKGACMAGGVLGGGHAWQGVCGKGVCVVGGCVCAGEMATEAGSMHPTGIHSCISIKGLYSSKQECIPEG